MTANKLTDNEIIKALEYWKKFNDEIDQMLCGRFKGDKMLLEQKEIVKITLNLFDLINRLQAQNERDVKVKVEALYKVNDLKLKNDRLQAQIDEMFDTLDYRAKKILELEDNLKTAKAENSKLEVKISEVEYDFSLLKQEREVVKAEAYKEFANKVKEKAYTYSDITGYQSTVVDINEIDGTYEELVGDK